MARAAGNSNTYTWKLQGARKGEEYFQDFPAVTHCIKSLKDLLGFGGMAWWGYKIGIRSQHPDFDIDAIDELYEEAKETEWTPNKVRDEAGERGTGGHDLLEAAARGEVEVRDDDGIYVVGPTDLLASIIWGKDDRSEAKRKFLKNGETEYEPVEHQLSAARWWIANKDMEVVFAERPVWSIRYGFQGTLDLGRRIVVPDYDGDDNPVVNGLEIVDYKSHKPSLEGLHKDGSYREGLGPAYEDDLFQLDGYVTAVEEQELGAVAGVRVVLLDKDGGEAWEDTRQLPRGSFLKLKDLHDDFCRQKVCRYLARVYGGR